MAPSFRGLILAACLACTAAAAQVTQATGPTTAPADNTAEVKTTLERYARAWYEGNATAMAQELHPEYARLTVRRNPTRNDAVDVISGLALLDMTDRGIGRNTAPAARKMEVKDVRIDGGKAQAVLVLADRVEAIQMVRWNNKWRVAQVLAERNEP